VFGRREALELLASGLQVTELLLIRSGEGETYAQVRAEAEARGLTVRFTDRVEFESRFPGQRHQGVAARYKPGVGGDLKELVNQGVTSGKPLVVLDGVEDPQNLGAVIRSAEVFGAVGVVIPRRRAAAISPAAVKASAGSALRLPVVSVGNLATALREIKSGGYWVFGLDMQGEKTLYEESFAAPVCIVLGGEGAGLARLTRDICDGLLRIPQEGKIGSLNVSAAAAVCLAELLRRRLEKALAEG
jgi:23S rRNA (guanosine2251-2'-O)-methyltransferase